MLWRRQCSAAVCVLDIDVCCGCASASARSWLSTRATRRCRRQRSMPDDHRQTTAMKRSAEHGALKPELKLRQRAGVRRLQQTEGVVQVSEQLRHRVRVVAVRWWAGRKQCRAQMRLRRQQPMPKPVTAAQRHRRAHVQRPRHLDAQPGDHRDPKPRQRPRARAEARDHRGKAYRDRAPAAATFPVAGTQQPSPAHLAIAAVLGVSEHQAVPDQRAEPPTVRTPPQLGVAQQQVELIDTAHKPRRHITERTGRDQGPRTVDTSPPDTNKPTAEQGHPEPNTRPKSRSTEDVGCDVSDGDGGVAIVMEGRGSTPS